MRTLLAKRVPLVALIFLIGASLASAGGRTTVTVRSAKNATLNTNILVDQAGMTLYHLTAEKGKAIGCSGACAKIWPPMLLAKGTKPKAGAGITASKLGTIKRPDGHLQVTYAGLALYRYSGDSKSGDAKGQGFQHVWYAISPSGKVVMAKAGSSGRYGP
jgi:predicted lipoprotein with Yx(FWY)xxD motif